MKIKNILLILIVFAVFVNAQTGSINNTIGTGGSFIVKDGANSYLRVDQSSGNTHFLKNMELGTEDLKLNKWSYYQRWNSIYS